MKFTILRIVGLLLLLANLTSCGAGRWRRIHYREHYVHKKRYRPWHEHRHRDW